MKASEVVEKLKKEIEENGDKEVIMIINYENGEGDSGKVCMVSYVSAFDSIVLE